MSSISLRDNLGLDLEVEPAKTSAIEKYFKAIPDLLIAGKPIDHVAALTLEDPAVTSFQTGLNLRQPIPVGTDQAAFNIKAGVNGALEIFVPDPDGIPGQDDSLFSSDDYGEDIPVAPTERYVSFSFIGTLTAFALGSVSDLRFGFGASTSISLKNYRKFSTVPVSPTVLEAIRETIAHFELPGSVEDLQNMEPDSIITLSGSGTLYFSASASILAAPNPLAVAHLPLVGALNISGGAAIDIGGSYRLSGKYEIRVRKAGPHTVRLGFFKQRNSEWKASVTASAGLELSFGDNDLLSKIVSAISPDAQADLNELRIAQIDARTTAAIQDTVEAGVQRALELALSFELGSLSSNRAAFLYEVDLPALDDSGRKVIDNALRGDLSGLVADEHLPAGIKMVQSVFTSLRQAKHTLQVNLLGIYNFTSVSKLALKGQILFDVETGELTLTDTATASNIKAGSLNIRGKPNTADPKQLRKLLASGVLVTASYRASGFVVTPPSLKFSQTYCEIHEGTNRKIMQGELDAAVGLGLLNVTEANDLLGSVEDFGRTVAYAAVSYDDALATKLFLHGEAPRSLAEYETIGRQAMQIAIHDNTTDPFRLKPLQEEDLWSKMKQKGQSGFEELFSNLSDTQRGAITADYNTIVWWAKTMSDTSQKLAEIRGYLAGKSASDNDRFEKLRSDFAEHLKKVAADTKEEFGRPWGLIAMDRLTGNQSNARIVFTGPVISLARQRRALSS